MAWLATSGLHVSWPSIILAASALRKPGSSTPSLEVPHDQHTSNSEPGLSPHLEQVHIAMSLIQGPGLTHNLLAHENSRKTAAEPMPLLHRGSYRFFDDCSEWE